MKYCPECGTKLVSQKFCHECGSNIEKYIKDAQNSNDSSATIADFDFSSLENEVQKQLAEKERLEKISAEFEIEGDVLKKYIGKGGKVIIPDGIKTIGKDSFRDNGDITEVIIPNGVEQIEFGAFFNVSNLKKVSIPRSVKEIGAWAFGKTSLSEVSLPEGIQKLSQGTFGSCGELKKVDLPSSLKIIESDAFNFTPKLLAIFIPRSVQVMGTGIFSNSGIVDIFFEADSLPATVATPMEGQMANCFTYWRGDCNAAEHFSCSKSQSVIPDYDAEAKKYGSDLNNYNKEDFEVYGNSAECLREMSTVRFPYGIKSCRSVGLKKCLNAEVIEFPETTTYFEWGLTGPIYGGNYLKTALRTVHAEGAVEIGSRAFEGCTSLTHFYSTDRLQVIEEGAFKDCSNLSHFTFPKMIRKLGAYAFSGVPALKNIKIAGQLKEIPSRAFLECPNLESVTVCDGITSIEEHAFTSCKKLKKIILPGSLEKIGRCAISFCEKLESIEIPEGVKEIEESAFEYCHSLKTVRIPYSVDYIGNQTFACCKNLRFVYLPRGKKDAFMKAFDYWTDTITFVEY